MILAIGLLLCSAATAQTADVGRQGNTPEELAGVARAWVAKRMPGVSRDISYLSYAYQMPQETRSALRHLVFARMAEQFFFEQKMAVIDLSGKTDAERLKWLGDLAQNSPLSPDRMEALAESLLPPRDFFTPRRVFEELCARRDQQQRAELTDDIQRQQLSVWMKRQRMAAKAAVTQAGHPMPRWAHARSEEKIAARISRQQERAAARRQAARRKASRDPGGSAVRRLSGEGAKPAPAPAEEPLVVPGFDDTLRAWRGYLRKIEADRGLDGRRRAIVEKTFSRTWQRARAFRATRRADYADLEKISRRSAFSERLAHLDALLRPLFEEFKLRLDSQVGGGR